MKNAQQKNRTFLQTTAWAVLGSFLFTTLAGPFAQASIWEDRRKVISSGSDLTEVPVDAPAALRKPLDFDFGSTASGIQVPEELGTVIDSWTGEGRDGKPSASPLIVEIEDAHGVYGAQKNSAGILNLLESKERESVEPGKDKGLLVCVEGAWGRVGPEWISVFPDDKVKRQTAESLLEQGQVTGEEYLSMISPPGMMQIWGVEKQDIYLANLKARKMLEPERASLVAQMGDFDRRLRRVKDLRFGKKLLELDGASQAFEDFKITLKEYFAYLKRIMGKPDPARYPALSVLDDLLTREAALSPQGIETERKKLLDAVSETLDKASLMQLAQVSLNFRLGKLSAQKYHEGLLRLARSNNIPVPQIEGYVAYLRIYQTLDSHAVGEELKGWEQEAYAKLIGGSPDLERVARLGRVLRMQKRFWTEKFSPDDWEDYQKNWANDPQAASLSGLEDGLKAEESRLGLPSIPQVFPGRRKLTYAQLKFLQESYYKLAFKRNEIMADNAVQKAKDAGRDRVILIAGGFHTSGMTSIFRQKGYPYVVIRPKLALAGETKPMEVANAPAGRDDFRDALKTAFGSLRNMSNLMIGKFGAPARAEWPADLMAGVLAQSGAEQARKDMEAWPAALARLAASDPELRAMAEEVRDLLLKRIFETSPLEGDDGKLYVFGAEQFADRVNFYIRCTPKGEAEEIIFRDRNRLSDLAGRSFRSVGGRAMRDSLHEDGQPVWLDDDLVGYSVRGDRVRFGPNESVAAEASKVSSGRPVAAKSPTPGPAQTAAILKGENRARQAAFWEWLYQVPFVSLLAERVATWIYGDEARQIVRSRGSVLLRAAGSTVFAAGIASGLWFLMVPAALVWMWASALAFEQAHPDKTDAERRRLFWVGFVLAGVTVAPGMLFAFGLGAEWYQGTWAVVFGAASIVLGVGANIALHSYYNDLQIREQRRKIKLMLEELARNRQRRRGAPPSQPVRPLPARFLQPVRLEDAIRGSGLTDEQVGLMERSSKGLTGIYDFLARRTELAGQGGFALGPSEPLALLQIVASVAHLEDWNKIYRDLYGSFDAAHTDDFLDRITSTRSNPEGKPIVFFVPRDMMSRVNSGAADEMRWFLKHPERMKNVYFVFGLVETVNLADFVSLLERAQPPAGQVVSQRVIGEGEFEQVIAPSRDPIANRLAVRARAELSSILSQAFDNPGDYLPESPEPAGAPSGESAVYSREGDSDEIVLTIPLVEAEVKTKLREEGVAASSGFDSVVHMFLTEMSDNARKSMRAGLPEQDRARLNGSELRMRVAVRNAGDRVALEFSVNVTPSDIQTRSITEKLDPALTQGQLEQRIADKILQALANADQQFKESGGTGLGLEGVRVSALRAYSDSRVTWRSDGAWTTFSLEMPKGPEEEWKRLEAEAAETAAAEVKEKAAEEVVKRRVLVVEGNPDDRKLYVSLLKRRDGHDVEAVENSEEGLAKTKEAAADGRPFELIVGDVSPKLVSEIRGTPAAPGVLAVTERTEPFEALGVPVLKKGPELGRFGQGNPLSDKVKELLEQQQRQRGSFGSILDPVVRKIFGERSWVYRLYTSGVAPVWETPAFQGVGMAVIPAALMASGFAPHIAVIYGLGWAVFGFSFVHTLFAWLVRAYERDGTKAGLYYTSIGVVSFTAMLQLFVFSGIAPAVAAFFAAATSLLALAVLLRRHWEPQDEQDLLDRVKLAFIQLIPYVFLDPLTATLVSAILHMLYQEMVFREIMPAWLQKTPAVSPPFSDIAAQAMDTDRDLERLLKADPGQMPGLLRRFSAQFETGDRQFDAVADLMTGNSVATLFETAEDFLFRDPDAPVDLGAVSLPLRDLNEIGKQFGFPGFADEFVAELNKRFRRAVKVGPIADNDDPLSVSSGDRLIVMMSEDDLARNLYRFVREVKREMIERYNFGLWLPSRRARFVGLINNLSFLPAHTRVRLRAGGTRQNPLAALESPSGAPMKPELVLLTDGNFDRYGASQLRDFFDLLSDQALLRVTGYTRAQVRDLLAGYDRQKLGSFEKWEVRRKNDYYLLNDLYLAVRRDLLSRSASYWVQRARLAEESRPAEARGRASLYVELLMDDAYRRLNERIETYKKAGGAVRLGIESLLGVRLGARREPVFDDSLGTGQLSVGEKAASLRKALLGQPDGEALLAQYSQELRNGRINTVPIFAYDDKRDIPRIPRRGRVLEQTRTGAERVREFVEQLKQSPPTSPDDARLAQLREAWSEYRAPFYRALVLAYRDPRFQRAYQYRTLHEVVAADAGGLLENLKRHLSDLAAADEARHPAGPSRSREIGDRIEGLKAVADLVEPGVFVFKRLVGDETGVLIRDPQGNYWQFFGELNKGKDYFKQYLPDARDSVIHSTVEAYLKLAETAAREGIEAEGKSYRPGDEGFGEQYATAVNAELGKISKGPFPTSEKVPQDGNPTDPIDSMPSYVLRGNLGAKFPTHVVNSQGRVLARTGLGAPWIVVPGMTRDQLEAQAVRFVKDRLDASITYTARPMTAAEVSKSPRVVQEKFDDMDVAVAVLKKTGLLSASDADIQAVKNGGWKGGASVAGPTEWKNAAWKELLAYFVPFAVVFSQFIMRRLTPRQLRHRVGTALFSRSAGLFGSLSFVAALAVGNPWLAAAAGLAWSYSSGYVFAGAHRDRNFDQKMVLFLIGSVLAASLAAPIILWSLGMIPPLPVPFGDVASAALSIVFGAALNMGGHIGFSWIDKILEERREARRAELLARTLLPAGARRQAAVSYPEPAFDIGESGIFVLDGKLRRLPRVKLLDQNNLYHQVSDEPIPLDLRELDRDIHDLEPQVSSFWKTFYRIPLLNLIAPLLAPAAASRLSALRAMRDQYVAAESNLVSVLRAVEFEFGRPVAQQIRENLSIVGVFTDTDLLLGELSSRYRWGMLRVSRTRPVVYVPVKGYSLLRSDADRRMAAFALVYGLERSKRIKELNESGRTPSEVYDNLRQFDLDWQDRERSYLTTGFRIKHAYRALKDAVTVGLQKLQLRIQFVRFRWASARVQSQLDRVIRKHVNPRTRVLDQAAVIAEAPHLREALLPYMNRLAELQSRCQQVGDYDLAQTLVEWSYRTIAYLSVVDPQTAMQRYLIYLRVLARNHRYNELRKALENLRESRIRVQDYDIALPTVQPFIDAAQASDFGPWLRSMLTRVAQITEDDAERAVVIRVRDDCLALLDQIPAVASNQALLAEELPAPPAEEILKGQSNGVTRVRFGRVYKYQEQKLVPAPSYLVASPQEWDENALPKLEAENTQFDAAIDPLIRQARLAGEAGADQAAALERIKERTHARVLETRFSAASQFDFILREEQGVAAHHHQVELVTALAAAREECLRNLMNTQRIASPLDSEETQQRIAEREARRLEYAMSEIVRDIDRKIVLARQQNNKPLITILEAERGLATMEPLETVIPGQIRKDKRTAASLIWTTFAPTVAKMRALGAKMPKQADIANEIEGIMYALFANIAKQSLRKAGDADEEVDRRVQEEGARFSRIAHGYRPPEIEDADARKAVDEFLAQLRDDRTVLRIAQDEISAGSLAFDVAASFRARLKAEGGTPAADQAVAQAADQILSRIEEDSRSGERSTEPEVLVLSSDITAADLMKVMEERNIVAIVSGAGSAGSHFSITAAGYEMPAINSVRLGQGTVYDIVADGDTIVLDGGTGEAMVNPGEEMQRAFRQRDFESDVSHYQARERAALPAITLDGKEMTVLANAASVRQAALGRERGARGVGLFRSEFLYDAKRPTVDDLKKVFVELGQSTDGKAAIRLADRAEDKKLVGDRDASRSDKWGSDFLLHDPAGRKIAMEQLRAAFLAYLEAPNIRVYFPQIKGKQDVDEALEMVRQVKEELVSAGLMNEQTAASVPIGFMIETASAVDEAKYIIEHADFVSIGSNDLTMSLFGLRNRQVPEAAQYFGRLHPSLLANIVKVLRVAAEVNQRMRTTGGKIKDVSICGDHAHIDAFIPFAIAASESGSARFDLSMDATFVAEVKELIRNMNAAEARSVFHDILAGGTNGDVDELNRKAMALVDEAKARIRQSASYQHARDAVIAERISSGRMASILGDRYAAVAPAWEWAYRVPVVNIVVQQILSRLGVARRAGLKAQAVSLVSGAALAAGLFLGGWPTALALLVAAPVWVVSSGLVFGQAHPDRTESQRRFLSGVGALFAAFTLLPVALLALGLPLPNFGLPFEFDSLGRAAGLGLLAGALVHGIYDWGILLARIFVRRARARGRTAPSWLVHIAGLPTASLWDHPEWDYPDDRAQTLLDPITVDQARAILAIAPTDTGFRWLRERVPGDPGSVEPIRVVGAPGIWGFMDSFGRVRAAGLLGEYSFQYHAYQGDFFRYLRFLLEEAPRPIRDEVERMRGLAEDAGRRGNNDELLRWNFAALDFLQRVARHAQQLSRPQIEYLSDAQAHHLAENIAAALNRIVDRGTLIPRSPISAFHREFEVETNGWVTRLGPLIFIVLPVTPGAPPRLIDLQLESISHSLRGLYSRHPGNIIFTVPSSTVHPDHREITPIDRYTLNMIALKLATVQDGDIAVEPGSAEALVSRVALRAGSRQVVLMERHGALLGYARELMRHDGFQESRTLQEGGDFIVFQGDFDHDRGQLERFVRENELDRRATVADANIGPWPMYGGANETVMRMLMSWSGLRRINNGGYLVSGDVGSHNEEFHQMENELSRAGFAVTPVVNDERGVLAAERKPAAQRGLMRPLPASGGIIPWLRYFAQRRSSNIFYYYVKGPALEEMLVNGLAVLLLAAFKGAAAYFGLPFHLNLFHMYVLARGLFVLAHFIGAPDGTVALWEDIRTAAIISVLNVALMRFFGFTPLTILASIFLVHSGLHLALALAQPEIAEWNGENYTRDDVRRMAERRNLSALFIYDRFSPASRAWIYSSLSPGGRNWLQAARYIYYGAPQPASPAADSLNVRPNREELFDLERRIRQVGESLGSLAVSVSNTDSAGRTDRQGLQIFLEFLFDGTGRRAEAGPLANLGRREEPQAGTHGLCYAVLEPGFLPTAAAQIRDRSHYAFFIVPEEADRQYLVQRLHELADRELIDRAEAESLIQRIKTYQEFVQTAERTLSRMQQHVAGALKVEDTLPAYETLPPEQRLGEALLNLRDSVRGLDSGAASVRVSPSGRIVSGDRDFGRAAGIPRDTEFRVVWAVNGAGESSPVFLPTDETLRVLFGAEPGSERAAELLFRTAESMLRELYENAVAHRGAHDASELISAQSLTRQVSGRVFEPGRDMSVPPELAPAYVCFDAARAALRRVPAGRISDAQRARMDDMARYMTDMLISGSVGRNAQEQVRTYTPEGAPEGTAPIRQVHFNGTWHTTTDLLPYAVVGGKIYVFQVRRSPHAFLYPNFWTVPGGHDGMKSPLQTAVEELREEADLERLGVRVEESDFKDIVPERSLRNVLHMGTACALTDAQLQAAARLARAIGEAEARRPFFERIHFDVVQDPSSGLYGLVQLYALSDETAVQDRLREYEGRLQEIGLPISVRSANREEQSFKAVAIPEEAARKLGLQEAAREGAPAAEGEITGSRWIPLEDFLRTPDEQRTDTVALLLGVPDLEQRLKQAASLSASAAPKPASQEQEKKPDDRRGDSGPRGGGAVFGFFAALFTGLTLGLGSAAAGTATPPGLNEDTLLAAAFSPNDSRIVKLTRDGKKEMLAALQAEVGAPVQAEVPHIAGTLGGQFWDLLRWQSVQVARTPEGALSWTVAPGLAYGLSVENGAFARPLGREELGAFIEISRLLVGLPHATLQTLRPSELSALALRPLKTLRIAGQLTVFALRTVLLRQWKALRFLAESSPAEVITVNAAQPPTLRQDLQEVADAVGVPMPPLGGTEGAGTEEARPLGLLASLGGTLLGAVLTQEPGKPKLIFVHVPRKISDDTEEARACVAAYREAMKGMLTRVAGELDDAEKAGRPRVIQFMVVMDYGRDERPQGSDAATYRRVSQALGIPADLYWTGAKNPEEAVRQYERMVPALGWTGAKVDVLTMKSSGFDGPAQWRGLLGRLGVESLITLRDVALRAGQVEVKLELEGAQARAVMDEIRALGLAGSDQVQYDEKKQRVTVSAKQSVTDLTTSLGDTTLFSAQQ